MLGMTVTTTASMGGLGGFAVRSAFTIVLFVVVIAVFWWNTDSPRARLAARVAIGTIVVAVAAVVALAAWYLSQWKLTF
jgi:hypothetical protein